MAVNSTELRTLAKVAIVAVLVAIGSFYLNRWIGSALGAK